MVIRSLLRLHAGQLLVDAGCGAGCIGLWLARALAIRLTGFDLSPIAVAQATARRAHFLGPVGDRAVLQVAELKKSGLPDGAAHGIVRVDALGEAADRGRRCASPAVSWFPAGGAPISFVKPGEDGRHDGSGSVGAGRGALCGWQRGRGRPEGAVG
ncbi:methyltransferase domain-containing protein [Streptomyces sp. NPDC096934]|uniref:SAM-dependent methyltransferase n=1 Tax=Streptomyces sp. NPDC096934 TaxID=3155551 RepID=UPI00331B0299